MICPPCKGRGNTLNVGNYRGRNILTCIGKLFTNILNARLYNFLKSTTYHGMDKQNNSTVNHIFALHCLINIYLKHKKRLQAGVRQRIFCGRKVGGKVLDVIKIFTMRQSPVLEHNIDYPPSSPVM